MQTEGRAPRARARRWQSVAWRRRAPPSIVSSSSFHRVKLDRQVFHLLLHDFLVIAITHFYCISVRAGFEHDVVLLGKMLVDVSRQAVKIPKRRHCPDGGVREQ